MRSAPKLGLTLLIAIGLSIGFVLAVETVIVKMIGDYAVEQQ